MKMYYSLFFEFVDTVPLCEVRAYFLGRFGYQVDGQIARYRHSDTGVSFSFDIVELVEGVHRTVTGVSFRLPFLRPHVFCLEAETEIREFLDRFCSKIFDQRAGSESYCGFSTCEFMRRWRDGSHDAFALRLRGNGRGRPVYFLPGNELNRAWRWNSGVAEYGKIFGRSVEVPVIKLIALGGVVRTGIVLNEQIPCVVPNVDIVLVKRSENPQMTCVENTYSGYNVLRQHELDFVMGPLEEYCMPFRVRIPQPDDARCIQALKQVLPPADMHIIEVAIEDVVEQELARGII